MKYLIHNTAGGATVARTVGEVRLRYDARDLTNVMAFKGPAGTKADGLGEPIGLYRLAPGDSLVISDSPLGEDPLKAPAVAEPVSQTRARLMMAKILGIG